MTGREIKPCPSPINLTILLFSSLIFLLLSVELRLKWQIDYLECKIISFSKVESIQNFIEHIIR